MDLSEPTLNAMLAEFAAQFPDLVFTLEMLPDDIGAVAAITTTDGHVLERAGGVDAVTALMRVVARAAVTLAEIEGEEVAVEDE